MRWLWSIVIGAAGGFFYVALTWAATLTGILEWYEQWDTDQLWQLVSIGPVFSLLALFLLASMLAHRYICPPKQDQQPRRYLIIIGLGFSIGATLTQLGLMHWEGIEAPRAHLVAGLFWGSSLLVSLLTVAFYRFISNR